MPVIIFISTVNEIHSDAQCAPQEAEDKVNGISIIMIEVIIIYILFYFLGAININLHYLYFYASR